MRRRPHAPLTVADVRALRATLTAFGREARAARRAGLDDAARRAFADPAALADYHDLMLFAVAHPASRAEHAHAGRELTRVAAAAHDIAQRGRAAERRALAQSGLAWTDVHAAFGLAFARWLVRRWPAHVRLDAIDADAPVALADAIAAALPPLQADVAGGGHLDADAIAASFAGDGDRYAWLVQTLDALPATAAVREQLFEAVGITAVVAPRDSPLSRTFARGPSDRPFTIDALVRKVDVARATAVSLPHVRRASRAAREAALDASRATLAMLGRETDAIATSSARDTEIHALGRGAAIALHAPAAGRRGPLDAHVGFVLYRNGVPVAYGGGWPFLGACRIGVNVLPAFRGGESAWLFAQVLRAYRQRFRVARFVVEPYQYGLGNREGLASGAFWFYWRLGFRPIVPRVRALAEDEAARMAADAGYRTPIATLRRFTASDVALDLADGPAPPDPSDLAEAASRWIARRGRGDAARAERAALSIAARLIGRKPPRDGLERDAWRAWAPLVAQLPQIATWPRGSRLAVAAVLRAKAHDEFAFQRALAAHRRLGDALAGLARLIR
jgi:hypothetical protein